MWEERSRAASSAPDTYPRGRQGLQNEVETAVRISQNSYISVTRHIEQRPYCKPRAKAYNNKQKFPHFCHFKDGETLNAIVQLSLSFYFLPMIILVFGHFYGGLLDVSAIHPLISCFSSLLILKVKCYITDTAWSRHFFCKVVHDLNQFMLHPLTTI